LFVGDHEHARELLALSLQEHLGLDDARGCAECLTGLAGAASAAGEPQTAARYFGAAAALRAASGSAADAVENRVLERFRQQAVDRLGTDVFAAFEAAGRRLTPADVLAELRSSPLPQALVQQ
jgi:hypothetical protein